MVKWRHVRLALMLGGFCLSVTVLGIVVWLVNTDADAERAKYVAELIDWRRCNDRAESGVQIDAVNDAAVTQAEETDEAISTIAATFDEIVALLESGSTPPSQRLVELRRIVDENTIAAARYGEAVDAYHAAAAAYVPQDPDACPPRPEAP